MPEGLINQQAKIYNTAGERCTMFSQFRFMLQRFAEAEMQQGSPKEIAAIIPFGFCQLLTNLLTSSKENGKQYSGHVSIEVNLEHLKNQHGDLQELLNLIAEVGITPQLRVLVGRQQDLNEIEQILINHTYPTELVFQAITLQYTAPQGNFNYNIIEPRQFIDQLVNGNLNVKHLPWITKNPILAAVVETLDIPGLGYSTTKIMAYCKELPHLKTINMFVNSEDLNDVAQKLKELNGLANQRSQIMNITLYDSIDGLSAESLEQLQRKNPWLKLCEKPNLLTRLICRIKRFFTNFREDRRFQHKCKLTDDMFSNYNLEGLKIFLEQFTKKIENKRQQSIQYYFNEFDITALSPDLVAYVNPLIEQSQAPINSLSSELTTNLYKHEGMAADVASENDILGVDEDEEVEERVQEVSIPV